jgi:hypothetical protein
MSNIEEIKRTYQEFQTASKTTLPKVDALLIEDLVIRQLQNPEKQSMYTIEVFSDGSRSTDDVRNDILAATGTAPSIHALFINSRRQILFLYLLITLSCIVSV